MAIAVVLQTWLVNSARVGLLADDATPMILTMGMMVTAGLSVGTALVILRAPKRNRVVGAVLLILGLTFAFAWPIGFWLALSVPDALATWAMGPSLPTWQGLVLAVLGGYSVARADG
jgi:hypothetical protein